MIGSQITKTIVFCSVLNKGEEGVVKSRNATCFCNACERSVRNGHFLILTKKEYLVHVYDLPDTAAVLQSLKVDNA